MARSTFPARAREFGAHLLVSLRVLLVMTVLLGVVYPLALVGVGLLVGDRADGRPLRLDGEVVGSSLLAQPFEGAGWFHPRPSAGGHDTLASAPSNLGPSNPELLETIEQRRADVAALEQVDPDRVPADALTASGSGLDPHLSPAWADLQVPRVARENGLTEAHVRDLVEAATTGRALGFLGQPVVNVVELNLALARELGAGGADGPGDGAH